jgi:hypothetical protein
MYRQWSGVPSGPEPAPDVLAADQQRAAGTHLVGRPFAARQQRSMSDAHGRQLEYGTEVKRESGAERMIASGGVDQEHVRRLHQGVDRLF